MADELKLGDNMCGHLMVAAIAELPGIVQSFVTTAISAGFAAGA